MPRILILAFALACSGCQMWAKWTGGDKPSEVVEPEVGSEAPANPDPSAGAEASPVAAPSAAATPNGGKSQRRPSNPVPPVVHNNDLELKFAKLWARVDELENQQIEQKERMKLLEKGLMLGIIPDELKNPRKTPRAEKAMDLLDEDDELKPKDKGKDKDKDKEKAAPVAEKLPVPVEKNRDAGAYRRLLEQAQEKFNAAQYGQAIVLFNSVSEQFDDSVTEGSQHYWIGLSWFYLKEYQLAEQSFKTLTEHFSQNSWSAHARFYQAKIDLNRGMSQRALAQFQLLMEEFANQDLGEMARMEVKRMKEKL